MPFLLLLLVAVTIGSLVMVLTAHYPTTAGVTQPSDRVAQEVGAIVAEHSRLRRLLRDRVDPTAATGLALTVALGVIFVAGIVFAGLAYLIRSSGELAELDRSIGQWGVDHRTEWSTDGLELFTYLGDTRLLAVLAVAVAVFEYLRRPSRWIVPFVFIVLVGEVLLTNGIKELLDRARPEFNPITATLSASFPSGHSAAAAAFFAAAALLFSRGRTPHQRAVIFGVAAGIAAGVAASRMMIGVHWFTDVIAGVLFGWAWFCACSIAFGGRLLEFGAPIERATEVAEREARRRPTVGATS